MNKIAYSVGFCAFLFTALSTNCSNPDAEGKYSTKEFRAILQQDLLPATAKRLFSESSEPSQESNDSAYKLSDPSYMEMVSVDEIYVTDAQERALFCLNTKGVILKRIGRYGQGPGEFSQPIYIAADGLKRVYVFDGGNQRISLFDTKSGFLSAFRAFGPCHSLDVDNLGACYIAFYGNDPSAPLIEIFNNTGSKIGQLGSRLSATSPGSFNDVDICVSDGRVYIAWKTYPLIRRYDPAGGLEFEHKLDFGLMREFGDLNRTAGKKDGGVRFWRVITKIRATLDGYYIMRTFPRLELIKVDFLGNIKEVYWKDIGPDYLAFDFFVEEGRNGTRFLVLENQPEPRLCRYYVGDILR
jgi:hypothetical protein